jgi:TetR/AcrR family transcriptional regulator, transcriptional repressor for nem operon
LAANAKISTKERLLQAGLPMLLQRGYHDLGLDTLLKATEVPKGSFYHHFKSKDDFALQVIDLYMVDVHAALDQCLNDPALVPLDRIRAFFEGTRDKYREDGYLGCLLGGLGQELSGVNETFRQKIDWCFSEIARRIAGCLELAVARGDLRPGSDPQQLANLLVDCWEGAALRSRLLRDPKPLSTMLDFYFHAAAP